MPLRVIKPKNRIEKKLIPLVLRVSNCVHNYLDAVHRVSNYLLKTQMHVFRAEYLQKKKKKKKKFISEKFIK